MFLIVNENGVSYTFCRLNGDIEVLAVSEVGRVRVSGRSRKEAFRKARQELRKLAEVAPFE